MSSTLTGPSAIPVSSSIQEEPNNIQKDINSRLIVCLCDLSADDAVHYWAGVPIEHCSRHKAAKLESLIEANADLAIGFSEIDSRGDWKFVSLEDARKRIQLNSGAS